MIAVNGYFDGNVIQTLEKLNARKNQRVIITLLDEEIETVDNRQKMTAAWKTAVKDIILIQPIHEKYSYVSGASVF